MVCCHAKAEANANTRPHIGIHLFINFDPNSQVIYLYY